MAKQHRVLHGGRFVVHSLHKVGDYWYGRVRDTATGKTRKVSTRERRKARAENEIIRWCDNQLEREQDGVVEGVRFKRAFREWLDLKTVRPSTMSDYEITFEKIFEPRFGDLYVDDITPKNIEAFIADLQKKRKSSPRTQQKHLGTLRGFFRWAVRHDHCRSDPTDGIKVARKAKRSGTALSHEEAQALLKACSDPVIKTVSDRRRGEWDQSFGPPDHLYTSVALALYTGLRRSNILRLEWRRVDLGRKRIVLPAEEMKANADHEVPIHPDLETLLREQLQKVSDIGPGSLVLGRSLEAIRTSFKAALKRAELPEIRWHDLRHTFASWLSTRCSFACLRELLGHSPGNLVTLQYTHVTWKEKVDAVNALPGFKTAPLKVPKAAKRARSARR